MKSPFVDVKAVADYLGVGRKIIYRLIDPAQTSDVLPHFKIGKKIKFRLDSPEMQAWLQRRQVNVSSEIVERTKASE